MSWAWVFVFLIAMLALIYIATSMAGIIAGHVKYPKIYPYNWRMISVITYFKWLNKEDN